MLYVPVLFYPEPWNGIMEHLRVLVERLDRARFQPLLATRPDDGSQTATLAARVEVETVDLGASRSVRPLWRAFRDVAPDVVHVHTPSTSGLAKLALAARLARVPRVMVTLHQVAPDELPWRSRQVNRAGQRLLDPVVAVSGGAADTQSARAGLDRARILVVHNGVEHVARTDDHATLLPRRAGDVWAGYFGRLAAEKGIDTLIDAVAEVRAAGHDLRLVVAGEGYERTNLEARAGDALPTDAVWFTGYRPDAAALISDVDVVVHPPPQFEGFGLVVAEAMAAGRPVVATDVVGGIPEMVVDGTTGLLVPGDDVHALAGALTRLCADAALRTALGTAGRARYLDGFTAAAMVERTVALY